MIYVRDNGSIMVLNVKQKKIIFLWVPTQKTLKHFFIYYFRIINIKKKKREHITSIFGRKYYVMFAEKTNEMKM